MSPLLLDSDVLVCMCVFVFVCEEGIRLQPGMRQRKEKRVRKRFSLNFSPWDWSPWLQKHFQLNVGHNMRTRERDTNTQRQRERERQHGSTDILS